MNSHDRPVQVEDSGGDPMDGTDSVMAAIGLSAAGLAALVCLVVTVAAIAKRA